jgi:hypothetical protein
VSFIFNFIIIISRLIRNLLRLDIPDALSPFYAIEKEIIDEKIFLHAKIRLSLLTILTSIEENLGICEIPANYYARPGPTAVRSSQIHFRDHNR